MALLERTRMSKVEPHKKVGSRALRDRIAKVRLGDVATQVRGVSYKPSDASEQKNADNVPLLGANNITENGLELDDLVYVDADKVSEKQYLQGGDILVCASSGSKKVVGKACFIEAGTGVTFGAFCKVVRPKANLILPKYLAQYFQSPTYRAEISRLANGASINNIRSEHLDDLGFSLPPLPARRRIADELDRLCALKKNAEDRLVLLGQIVKSRFVEMFGDGDFAERELIAIAKFIDYRGKTPTKAESGIPLITAKNVRAYGFSQEPREYIPVDLFDSWMSRGFPRVGDVLFTTEAPLGNVCRIPNVYTKFAVGQRIVTMQPDETILNAVYLENALLSEAFQAKLIQHSSGSTVKGIRSKLLEKLTITLPPLALQREFAAFVAEVDKSEAALRETVATLDQLYRAKLQEYFG